jgi:hypothetical protein
LPPGPTTTYAFTGAGAIDAFVHQSTTFDFDRVRRRFSGVYWLRKRLPMICKREEKRSLRRATPRRRSVVTRKRFPKLRPTTRKVSIFDRARVGVELFLPVVFGLFEKIDDGGGGFPFLADPFFHFPCMKTRTRGFR